LTAMEAALLEALRHDPRLIAKLKQQRSWRRLVLRLEQRLAGYENDKHRR
jgi:hypothetical protein